MQRTRWGRVSVACRKKAYSRAHLWARRPAGARARVRLWRRLSRARLYVVEERLEGQHVDAEADEPFRGVGLGHDARRRQKRMHLRGEGWRERGKTRGGRGEGGGNRPERVRIGEFAAKRVGARVTGREGGERLSGFACEGMSERGGGGERGGAGTGAHLWVALLDEALEDHGIAYVSVGRRKPIAGRVALVSRDLEQHAHGGVVVEQQHEERGDVAEALVVIAILRPDPLEKIDHALLVLRMLEGALRVTQKDAEGSLVVANT
eukprot:6188224-Pleurochrysis_carterae.AAC.1